MRSIPSKPALAPHVRRQIDRTSGEPLLLHPEGAVELNPSADAIVRACDGTREIEEIVASLAGEYGEEPATIRGEVRAFLADLAGRGLLA